MYYSKFPGSRGDNNFTCEEWYPVEIADGLYSGEKSSATRMCCSLLWACSVLRRACFKPVIRFAPPHIVDLVWRSSLV